MQKGVQLNFNKRYSFNPILPGPFECIPPPLGFILGFEVKVRKLIEDVIYRQESHQAKEFRTLRCLEPPEPSVTFLVVGPS